MPNVKIVLNSAGVQELLKSQEIISAMEEHAHSIVRRCSGNYEVSTYTGKKRANVSIVSKDSQTYYRNLKDNELLKGLK